MPLGRVVVAPRTEYKCSGHLPPGVRAFRIAYDGRDYHGFQRQPDVSTVEDALLDALAALGVLDGGTGSTGSGGRPTPPGYAAAGRTDAGVSALAQTVAFEAPDWLSPAALNGELPADVRAWASAPAPADFHATHYARAREYVYHLHAPRSGPAGEGTGGGPAPGRSAGDGADLDDDRARAAVAALSGAHDFHNLTADDEGTERDLSLSATRDGEFLVLRARAGGFPRGLVRRLAALVAEVARGESPVSKVDRVLAAEPLPGPEGVGPAPPEPLVLVDVDYDLPFAVDEAAAASARSVFADRRSRRLAGARTAGAVLGGLARTGDEDVP